MRVKKKEGPIRNKHVKKLDMFMLARFEFIETRLFWGEGLRASDLAEAFGITRQSAQTTIDDYRRRHPRQMRYDPKRKRHVPEDSFSPSYIRTAPIRFLDYLRGQTLAGFYREERGWSDIELTDVDRLLRPELPLETIRTVLSALLRKQVVQINYRSKNLESLTVRSISPNHLVFAEDRYHLRAYCHQKQYFLDFVLSRILWAEITNEEWVSSAEDKIWNTFTTLRFRPNPKLPMETQDAVLKNYETQESGYRIVRCREALAYYIKRKLLSSNNKYGTPLWEEV
ncbi:MAG: WYL domain-containing protein [Deltaproteobacteria bacterium]|nr:WYL domain-containing protein [Deltaproteobacteria bacterium]